MASGTASVRVTNWLLSSVAASLGSVLALHEASRIVASIRNKAFFVIALGIFYVKHVVLLIAKVLLSFE
jgi:hypothetical protein